MADFESAVDLLTVDLYGKGKESAFSGFEWQPPTHHSNLSAYHTVGTQNNLYEFMLLGFC
jgi:hypothetical protein